MTYSVSQQHKKNHTESPAIKRLIDLMNRTTADTDPPLFEPGPDDPEDIRKLAASYNALMKRMTENLKRSRQFAADVTHELRTPLTILRGETELALRKEKSQGELRKVLESNLEEISRMSYLIEDLLLLSKSDLGEIPLKMGPLLLQELILELHHQAQLLAENKAIHVELNCPEKNIFVRADNLRLRQVFLNLISNAIKYTPDQGTVNIHVIENSRGLVEISIRDTGIGIAPNHLELIFERFYRVDKTQNRNDGGSGLGLAIVKWIVEAHQGTISVTSRPGEGSCFTITLPTINET